jgi:hypothetical protein
MLLPYAVSLESTVVRQTVPEKRDGVMNVREVWSEAESEPRSNYR